jgi:hypothetical protein
VSRSAADVLADLATLAARQAALTAELAEALRVAPAPAPPAPAAGPEYLTTAEVAGLLGVTVKGLERLRADGRGPRYIRVGRMVRYPRDGISVAAAVQPPSSPTPALPSAALRPVRFR